MRDVFERLAELGIPYFITGSVAAAAYGSLRQTFDTDVVLDLDPARFGAIVEGLEDAYLVAEPITFADRSMASLISIATVEKLDLIMRRPDAWGSSAMARRQRWAHPDYGDVWVSSVEDLILAKLQWSEGTSELQLRDCAALLRLQGGAIDGSYLARWSRALAVEALLEEVRRAT